jgi:hypothetical protein
MMCTYILLPGTCTQVLVTRDMSYYLRFHNLTTQKYFKRIVSKAWILCQIFVFNAKPWNKSFKFVFINLSNAGGSKSFTLSTTN